MPRARNLKPGFFKNEDLAACGPWAMLLFEGLWILADRSGRLEDRPSRIRVEIFPYAPRTNVVGLLTVLADKNFITRYEVSGHKYIEIQKFIKHQNPHIKEAESTIPAPCSAPSVVVSDTVLARLNPESPLLNPESLSPKALAPDGAGVNGKELSPVLESLKSVATEIHGRHPKRRNMTAVAVCDALVQIAKHKKQKPEQWLACAQNVNENHLAWCHCDEWTRESGRYVKNLKTWLRIIGELYDIPPDEAPQSFPAGKEHHSTVMTPELWEKWSEPAEK